MALWGQNHGVYRSKVWHFGVVTHGGLATPDYKTTSQQDFCFARQRVNETTSGAAAGGASPELRNHGFMDLRIYGFWFRCVGQRTMATLCYARQLVYETFASQDYKSTRLRDNKWGGSRWSFAGITDRASRLETQSSVTLYTLYTPLYSLYPSILSILTTHC